MSKLFLVRFLLVGIFITPGFALSNTDKLFQTHCSSCHGADRLGGVGPALLPENLTRLKKKEAVSVIGSGRAATQMPAFEKILTSEQIISLVDMIYTPLASVPPWGMEQIGKGTKGLKKPLVGGSIFDIFHGQSGMGFQIHRNRDRFGH